MCGTKRIHGISFVLYIVSGRSVTHNTQGTELIGKGHISKLKQTFCSMWRTGRCCFQYLLKTWETKTAVICMLCSCFRMTTDAESLEKQANRTAVTVQYYTKTTEKCQLFPFFAQRNWRICGTSVLHRCSSGLWFRCWKLFSKSLDKLKRNSLKDFSNIDIEYWPCFTKTVT